jgi:hydrogenase maturation protein HypF
MNGSGIHIEIRGTVQGVGYRPWVYQLARRMDIRGAVCNDSRGVSIDAFGGSDVLERFVIALRSDTPPAARVRSVTYQSIPFVSHSAFAIAGTMAGAERHVSIPADLAVCDDCLREMLDPDNRRYRYPFINCTNCGPRYSIVLDAPYDRGNTTMASFRMCDACRAEYDDPDDRRFHAQPNACPDCGPRLVAMDNRQRQIVTRDPIHFAARALRAGLTVALKGIGGFHLACDATSASAVTRLRDRKRRERKPLAVMVRDLAQAEEVAELSDVERELLLSVERPIVLVRSRAGSPVASQVSGAIPLIGVVLPYHAAAPPASARRRHTAGDDVGQPFR